MSMTNADPVLRFLLGAAAAGVLLVVLSALSPVLVPFLQAAFLIGILISTRFLVVQKETRAVAGRIACGDGNGAEFDRALTEPLSLYGFVNWIGYGELDGSWEVECGLRYFLTPWLRINGGYVYSGLKIVTHDPEGFFRVQSNNIFFGATLGF